MNYINVTVVHFIVQTINQTGTNCKNWNSSNSIETNYGINLETTKHPDLQYYEILLRRATNMRNAGCGFVDY